MTTVNPFKITRTRFETLGLCNTGPNLWRFCDMTDHKVGDTPRVVGAHYRTKVEALADLNRYATEVWGL